MSGLVLKHVNKVYPGDQQAIRDFSLEIKDKEFMALVGQDGCGKSTLLRMIAGLEEITSGTLFMDGEDVTNRDTKQRNVAMIFKNNVLYPGMTVEENLSFALKMAKVPQTEIAERMEEVAELLELRNLLEKETEELGAVDYYRVLLGRALMKRPGILLLDSTIADLDEKVQAVVRKEFARIYEKMNMTVIYVTDNQRTALALGKRMVVMNKGEICQDGKPEEIVKKPKNSYVAGVVGYPQMNFLQAAVFEENGQAGLDFKKGKILLTKEKGKALLDGGYQKKEVTVGIRANGMQVIDKKSGKGNPTVKVLAVEQEENTYRVRFLLGEAESFCLMDRNPSCEAEEMAALCIDTEKIQIFDQETKTTIIF
jgi:multiple sugar transport system ATP-binding protein